MTKLELAFQIYKYDVLKWHKVAGVPSDNENIFRYIKSPEMIQSEIKETLDAAKEKDAQEYMDGLLDILWEVNFVNEHFKTYNAFVTYLGCEPALKHFTLGSVLRVLRDSDNPSGLVNCCEVLERLCYERLEDTFTEEEITKSLNQVTQANFSKFVSVPDCEDEEVVQSIFKKEEKFILESGKAEVVNYSLHWGGGATLLMVFKNENGKLMKPSSFQGPDHSHIKSKV